MNILLKRAVPALYATSFIFNNQSETKRPTVEEKLNLEPPDIKKLTVEYMIQQSIVDSINNATQALNIAYMAVMRTSNEYKSLLCSLISLTKDTLEFHVNDEHWDLIVETRSEVQTKKEQLNKLTGYVQYVQKMAVAASDLSYLSGMDNLCFSLTKQIDDVFKSMQQESEFIATLEQEYCDIQEQCIRNSTNSDNKESTE
ncbi:uncharacterized protein LOC116424098 isoform X2 [Nomia melanderi]|uniref:uncharacterized protein LOC116424098 isoform X2 n=1 Tax=Nomia melanderi TaxID=2448451 RepID=UPI00130461FD|nr:uncharacterized protein LOC116424098 isoform X2 [Nomia melanderi]